MNLNIYKEYYKNIYQILNEKEQKLVYSIIDYISENYTQELTINKLTEKFGITDTKLNKILMCPLRQVTAAFYLGNSSTLYRVGKYRVYTKGRTTIPH